MSANRFASQLLREIPGGERRRLAAVVPAAEGRDQDGWRSVGRSTMRRSAEAMGQRNCDSSERAPKRTRAEASASARSARLQRLASASTRPAAGATSASGGRQSA